MRLVPARKYAFCQMWAPLKKHSASRPPKSNSTSTFCYNVELWSMYYVDTFLECPIVRVIQVPIEYVIFGVRFHCKL